MNEQPQMTNEMLANLQEQVNLSGPEVQPLQPKQQEERTFYLNDKEYFFKDMDEKQLQMLASLDYAQAELGKLNAQGRILTEGRDAIVTQLEKSLDDSKSTTN
jgi:hypothetical protein